MSQSRQNTLYNNLETWLWWKCSQNIKIYLLTGRRAWNWGREGNFQNMKMVNNDQGDNYLFWNPQECMIESIKYGHLQIPLHSTPFSPRISFISLFVFMTFLCLNDDISLHSYVPVLRGQKFLSFHFWDFVLFTHFGFFVCLLSSSFHFQRSISSLRGFKGRRSSYKVAD